MNCDNNQTQGGCDAQGGPLSEALDSVAKSVTAERYAIGMMMRITVVAPRLLRTRAARKRGANARSECHVAGAIQKSKKHVLLAVHQISHGRSSRARSADVQRRGEISGALL